MDFKPLLEEAACLVLVYWQAPHMVPNALVLTPVGIAFVAVLVTPYAVRKALGIHMWTLPPALSDLILFGLVVGTVAGFLWAGIAVILDAKKSRDSA